MRGRKAVLIVSLLTVALIALTPLIALRDAEFGGSDDAGSRKVEELAGEGYTPWFTPVLEQVLGRELPGEAETLFFCLQTGIGVGVVAFGFGYLVGRRSHEKED